MVINEIFHGRLRIAFKWMVRAFSGYLSTDQLLLLWDRILGYESLEIVAGGSVLLHFYKWYRNKACHLDSHIWLAVLLITPLVLAAAVFTFRAENLMEVTSLASAEVSVCAWEKVKGSEIACWLKASTSNPVSLRHVFESLAWTFLNSDHPPSLLAPNVQNQMHYRLLNSSFVCFLYIA